MVKVLHTSDIHLEKQLLNSTYPSEYAVSRRNELWETTKKILDYSEINQVDLVLIAGDLFESEYFLLGELYKLYDLFSRYENLRIVILTGNHDSFSNNSIYRQLQAPKNVHLLCSDRMEYIEFQDLKTRVYGIGWMKDSYSEIKVDNIELDHNYINILMLHGNLASTDKDYMYFDLNSLNKTDFDYIALGHIHSFMDLAENIAYSGSPEPLDFGEQGEKGFLIININKGNCIKNFVPFSKRKFTTHTYNFDENSNEEDFIHEMLDISNATDFFRIYLNGVISAELSLKLDYMLKSLVDSFYYIEFINNTYIEKYRESMNQDPYLIEFSKYINNLNIDDSIKERALKKGLSMIIGDSSVNAK